MEITQEKNILTLSSTPTANTKYIHVVEQVTITDQTIFAEYVGVNESVTDLTKDSYFILTEMILPDAEGAWNYYIDGNNKIIGPHGDVSVTELLALQSTEFVVNEYNWFSKYHLNKYYTDLVKSRFLKNICACGCINKSDKIILDTLVMGIDLIDTLLLENQYYEAQRILEQLSTCFNIVEINKGCNCDG